ncbi:MAG: hypothetical protein PWQ44_2331, partial [Methanolobus sp.]|nr:hypothetical protein [Methanolobus sp.]
PRLVKSVLLKLLGKDREEYIKAKEVEEADFCSLNRSITIIAFQVASGKPDKGLPASYIRTFTLYRTEHFTKRSLNHITSNDLDFLRSFSISINSL